MTSHWPRIDKHQSKMIFVKRLISYDPSQRNDFDPFEFWYKCMYFIFSDSVRVWENYFGITKTPNWSYNKKIVSFLGFTSHDILVIRFSIDFYRKIKKLHRHLFRHLKLTWFISRLLLFLNIGILLVGQFGKVTSF